MARTIFAGGRVDWNDGVIRVMLTGPDGEVAEDVRRRARAVQKRAQRRAPFRTGRLRYGISVETAYPPTGPVASVVSEADHTMMVEFGRRRVEPVEKKRLNWLGDSGPVFALSAPPIEEVPFMRESIDAAAD